MMAGNPQVIINCSTCIQVLRLKPSSGLVSAPGITYIDQEPTPIAVFSPRTVQGMTEGCGWGVAYDNIKAFGLTPSPTSERNLY